MAKKVREEREADRYRKMYTCDSKNPFIRAKTWLKNYWYYYKAYTLFAALVLALGIWFVCEVVFRPEADMRAVVMTESYLMEIDENGDKIGRACARDLQDVDGDGKVLVETSVLYVSAEAVDEYELASYEQALTYMVEDRINFFIVDEYAYQFLRTYEALTPLKEAGLDVEDDLYRISINNTWLTEDTPADGQLELYLVLKVRSETMNEDNNARYDAAVALAQTLLDAGQEVS